MDKTNISRYHTPRNSPNRFSSDSSNYFTPNSCESSHYSSPNNKTFIRNEIDSIYTTPKSKNVALEPETTKYFTPKRNDYSRNSTNNSDTFLYSTPMTARNSKVLRFGETTRFDSPQSRIVQNNAGETFSSLMKQTWLETDTSDTESQISEDFSQDTTLIPNESNTSSLNYNVNKNPFLEDLNLYSQTNHITLPEKKLSKQKNRNSDSENDPKLNDVLNRLEFLNSEFEKMKCLEKQMIEMSEQMGHLRENLVQQSLEAYNMAKQLLDSKIFPAPVVFNQQQEQAHSKHQNYSVNDRPIHHLNQERLNDLKITQIQKNTAEPNRLYVLEQKLKNYRDKNVPELNNFINNSSKEISDFSEADDPVSENLNQAALIRSKLFRLPALVKGYLVRRLMQTQRVQQLRKTMKDTSLILIKFKNNLVQNDGKLHVTHQDILFHQQLCNQLESACLEFYKIFFNTSKKSQMSMIRQHREHLREISSRNSERSHSALSNATSQRSTSSYYSTKMVRNRNDYGKTI